MSEVLGIVPAAGLGSRLWPYRAPKELIQVGYHEVGDAASPRLLPKAAVEHVLLAMRCGAIRTAFIVVSPAKWEVLRYLGDGGHLDIGLAYLCQEEPKSMPHAIDLVRPFAGGRDVCLGMPDTIVRPDDCYAQLRDFHTSHHADVSLGVFPTADPRSLAPVLIEPGTCRVLAVVDKPEHPPVDNTWGIAIWSPAFTELLHETLNARPDHGCELSLSDVFVAAVTAGLRVFALAFPQGEFHDIGTPEGVLRTRGLLEFAPPMAGG